MERDRNVGERGGGDGLFNRNEEHGDPRITLVQLCQLNKLI